MSTYTINMRIKMNVSMENCSAIWCYPIVITNSESYVNNITRITIPCIASMFVFEWGKYGSFVKLKLFLVVYHHYQVFEDLSPTTNLRTEDFYE